MVSGIKVNKSIPLIVFLILICSCGSRRSLQIPYNGSLHTTENGRVILESTPVVTPIETPRPEVVQNPLPLISNIEKAPAGTWKGNIQSGLDSLCRLPLFQTTQLGLYVYDLTDQLPVYAVNATQRMRPASNQKIVTSICGLHYLGGDYLFRTDLRIKGTVANGTLQGDVYVVGGMDPMLSPSNLAEMATALRNAGISSITGNLYIDLSMKDNLPYGWGWCWDDKDGPLSALMVDAKDKFNTEWVKALSKAGIRCSRSAIKQQQIPADTKSVCCVTHTIDEVLQPLLKNSHNIYAESLFYQIAAFSGQKNAGRKQAAQLINDLISKLDMQPEQYQIADGSGLSLYNYVSPELLVSLLNYAFSKPDIYQHLYPALPIAGIDGTLSKRMQDTPAYNNVHAKTGTVDGVSTLAGYLTASNGHVLSFSIMNQGVSYGRLGREFQDKVCILLCQ